MMKVFRAFAGRDLKASRYYRLSALFNASSILLAVATYFFLGKIVSGSDYFSFVLVGIATSQALLQTLNAAVVTLENEKKIGTLPLILTSAPSDIRALRALLFWPMALGLMTAVAYFVAGAFVFRWELRLINVLLILPAFAAYLVIIGALGQTVLAATLRYRRGTALTWVLSSILLFLGGIYFPTSLFPNWLMRISDCLPLTAATTTLRLLLSGADADRLGVQFAVLGANAILLHWLGTRLLRATLKSQRMSGSLTAP